jgi:hypothetical protein
VSFVALSGDGRGVEKREDMDDRKSLTRKAGTAMFFRKALFSAGFGALG